MARSTKTNKGGRPATGKDPLISARVPRSIIAGIDAWVVSNGASRSEAIRRLVELGLTVKPKAAPSNARRSTRALELAAKTIDGLSDDLASATDQESRKRRLLKGPEEFRKVRIDRTKK
jgi:Arc/MetJ-type ribon-helix-helix transcriptional regulator